MTKAWAIYRFEMGYQVRRPWPWLVALLLLVVSFLLARDNSLADAMYEDFPLNAPFAIAKSTVVATLLWLMIGGVIAGEAGGRDVATGMHPLVFSSPMAKGEYLGGRFLAALSLNVLLLLVVQLGILLGIYSPGVAGANLAPFRAEAYLTAFAYLSLPNALFATAVQYGVALRTGRPMAAYLGSFLIFFCTFFIASFVRLMVWPRLGMLLDPIGLHYIIDGVAHDWTTIEKKVRLLGFEGIVLHNRLVWLSIGLVATALTYARFRFEHRVASTWRLPWRRASARPAASAPPDSSGSTASDTAAHALRVVPQDGGFAFHLRQTMAVARGSLRAIVTSWAALALLLVVPLLMVVVLIDQMSSLGTPLLPTTSLILRELTAPLSAQLSRWVIVPPVIVYFAGELVWREREAGLGEISDALPGSEWPPLLGKLLGLTLFLALFMATLTASGVVAQAILGHHHFELGLYATQLFALQLTEYLLFAALALAIHVVVNQKYVGHLVGMMAYAFIALLAGLLGVHHPLLVFGAGPEWTYTVIRGFGGSIGAWLWFKLYWVAWAALVVVAARLLWVRGREGGLATRMREGRRRLAGGTLPTGVAAAALVLSLGGFVFYNTNVRNEYRSPAATKGRMAEYEHRYGRFERMAQPTLVGASVRVDIHPRARSAEISGTYRLVNRSATPIDSVLVSTATRGAITRAVSFDRPSRVAVDDGERAARVYVLERAVEPGDSLRMEFDVRVEPRGFGVDGVDRAIAPKGSFFTNAQWFPSVGFNTSRALISAADRRAHGLPPRPILGALHDDSRDASSSSGGVDFHAVLGTDADQVAVAPGDLRRSWTEGSRRLFEYATSGPIGEEWAFFSARYAVREDQWNGVTIRIFHTPEHTAHLDRVLRSVRASLDYYGAQFGAYRFRHLTIVENPVAPGAGAHANPSLIYHGESYAVWIPRPEPKRLDMPYAVMAHEMAHEWPHPYALVEGLPFLAEGLAWYFGMHLVKESRGEEQLHRLLTFMRAPYPHPVIRRGEPLLRAMDPYMSYRKGPMTMFALSHYAGADRVNGAIRRFFETHTSPGAPLATTLDLYRELQRAIPDSLAPMLRDFFELNASWQLTTERVSAVETRPGTWEVTLDVRGRKQAYDTAGVVTELPLEQWVPVGVFAAPDPGHADLSKPLYLRMHRIRSGQQRITVTVRGTPTLAGIDPHHLIDWEEMEDDDNVMPVPLAKGAASPAAR